jgi:glycosyltransferase involved in cell wall biosynthesis
MRVLMLTRRVDRDDARAGFVHTWIERLAGHPRVECVHVICLESGVYELPDSVSVASMGKERGYGRLRELLEFQKAIAPAIGQVDVVFGHMIPRYVIVAAPWALLHRVPVVLWYTHRSVTPELRLAHALARRVVTASPESFRLPSRKVQVIGHGIDMARFALADRVAGERLVVGVGRLSPVKHYDVLIRAVALLAARPGFEDVRLAIAGGATDEDASYAAGLRALIAQVGAADRVDLLGALPPAGIPDLFRRAAVSANLCPTGGADKVVLESMACGVPVVVHNATFLPLLAEDAGMLWSGDLDPERVADRLAAVLALPGDERAALGARLAARVRADYDLDALIDRLVGVFEAVTGARGAA